MNDDVKKVTMYKDSKDKLHETKELAIKANRLYQLKEGLLELVNQFYYNGQNPDDLVDDLIERKDDLKRLLR